MRKAEHGRATFGSEKSNGRFLLFTYLPVGISESIQLLS